VPGQYGTRTIICPIPMTYPDRGRLNTALAALTARDCAGRSLQNRAAAADHRRHPAGGHVPAPPTSRARARNRECAWPAAAGQQPPRWAPMTATSALGASAVEVSRSLERSSHNEVMITPIPTHGYVDS
jgi:hypothetical protein